MRRRRSMLFVPGDHAKKLAKAAQSATDGVILELEDGVALNHKGVARAGVIEALRSLDFGPRERAVNEQRTGLLQKLDDAIQPGVGDVRQPRGPELGERFVGGHGDGTPRGPPADTVVRIFRL